MVFSSHIIHSLKPVAWAWGVLFLLAATVSAQPFSVCCMGYTTIDENTFYVLGGERSLSEHVVSHPAQFHSLDLQTGWNTSSPLWEILEYPYALLPVSAISSAHSMAVAPDNRTFSVWTFGDNDTLAKYSVDDDYWTPVSLNYTWVSNGLRAVTDPTTGLVYIPGGGSNYSAMLVYNPANSSMEELPSSKPLVIGRPYYTFVWSNVRNSFIYFTGNSSNNPFSEYTPSTRQWSKMVSSGNVPPSLYGSCMVPAYNGTKMILFGGEYDETQSAGLYILDVTSMTWSEAVMAADARTDMTCSVSGDNFIIWGGYKLYEGVGSTIGLPTEPIIYNMYTKNWTTTYTRAVNGYAV